MTDASSVPAIDALRDGGEWLKPERPLSGVLLNFRRLVYLAG